MPRSITRSIAASRLLDMPTSIGDLIGRPSPARVTVRAVRITRSNANSLNYTYLYWPYSTRFLPGRMVPLQLYGEARRTVANDSGIRKSPDFRRKLQLHLM